MLKGGEYMGLISGLTKATKNTAKAVSDSEKAATSKSNSSSSSSSSSGYYNASKDYAAAIAKATSTSEKNQLVAERQNKINAMNASGINTAGYSNSIYSGGSSGGSGSSGTALTADRIATIQKMYSGVSYDANTDYAAAIKKASERFGSEPYNVVQGEIDKLENQRYAKMLATGQINSSNMASYQPANYGTPNYGQYTPDYYEKVLQDNASATGAVNVDSLAIGYGDLNGLLPDYQQQQTNSSNAYDFSSALSSYDSQIKSYLESLKQTNNYNTSATDDVTNASRNVYKYDNPYKGGQGATIKKNNAVSKYLANTAFKDGKFNQ